MHNSSRYFQRAAAVAFRAPAIHAQPATAPLAFVRRLSTNNKTPNTSSPFYVTFTELSHAPGCLATITMNNPRANTFDYNSLYALGAAVSIVETKTDVRGLVLQSAVDGFFSGGFRLPIFHQITHAEFMRLWVLGKSIFRRIHALPVPSVAAIDGHALGLGCALALACQFRFMVHRAESAKRTGLFGLNEVAVGLPVPEWLAARFRDLTTPRAAEDLLAIGATLPADRACKIGIIDRVFGSADDMHGSILADLEKRVAVPKEAQAQTISLLRRDYLDYFDACYERDNEQIWTALSSQSTQEAVASALAKLKAKRESKPSGETK